MVSIKKKFVIISIILICMLFFSACDGIQINANAQGSPDQEGGLDLGIEIEGDTSGEETGAPASNNPEMNTLIFTVLAIVGLVVMVAFVIVTVSYGTRRRE